MNVTQSGKSVHQLFKRLQTVGKGSYGSVHKGVELATGNVVALKIINLDDDEVDSIQQEVALLSQLRDAPNVTRYYGSYLDGPRLWIVMDFAQGGSVYQLMKASPGNILEEKYVVVLVREVLVGLAYLHKSGIIHRDIKSANVLVTSSGRVMICDFGVSALLATNSSKRNTFIGTLNWMAPEVVQAVPNYDTKADIWSLGIMIYEMIKGSPPHSNVSQERIIQLIPRAKPPRLIVGEGSKDLLDFIPLCLAEKPGDRLPAEELLKTKWIKTAKAPVTVLKDLLLRYETWAKSSSEAADLNEPLPWEQDEADELGYVDVGGENPWEFDTVRGSRAIGMRGMGLLSPDTSMDDSEADAASTIRPPASKLPSSLRLLFDDGTEEPPDPFRIPGFGGSPAPRSADSPAPSFATPPSINPTPSRAPRRAQTAAASPLADDGPDLSKAAFSFPSRAPAQTQPRSKSRLGADDDSSSESLSVSRGPSPAESMLSGAEPRTGPFYRAVRSARNVPDIEIPTPASSTPSPAPASSAPEEPSINLDGAMMGTTTRRPPSAGRNRSRTYASPPVFQFPPPSTGSNTPDSAQSSGSTRTVRPNHDRSPTTGHAPASSTTSGHSATHSLDAPPTARRVPASAAPALGAGLAPGANAPTLPPLGRSQSATPFAERAAATQSSTGNGQPSGLVRKPSLNRLASVAVMETVPPTPTSARRVNRSGGSLAELGLRDVLKVPALSSEHQMGMADLLPPSPSAAALAPRHAPTSSHSPLSLELPRAPPLPRPIDLPALARSHADTHAELARVVDELGQWLALVDAGLGRLLEGAGGDRIEEGEEDGLEGRKSALAIG